MPRLKNKPMENKMNSSKKMLTIATSISMVMFSASALLFSVHKTFADPAPVKLPTSNLLNRSGISSGIEIYPFGINAGKAYWMEYNNSGWNWKYSEVSTWTNNDK